MNAAEGAEIGDRTDTPDPARIGRGHRPAGLDRANNARLILGANGITVLVVFDNGHNRELPLHVPRSDVDRVEGVEEWLQGQASLEISGDAGGEVLIGMISPKADATALRRRLLRFSSAAEKGRRRPRRLASTIRRRDSGLASAY